jgi:hypothetical protein
LRPNLTADEAVTKPAFELAVGDHVMGDLLPLGVPGEVIYRRLFERNRSEWMFVAYVQRDGFHDSTTFLADAPIRVRVAEPARVADPTGLLHSRADEADDPTPVSGARVRPHTGAMTDEGLVDETEVPHEVLVERGLIDNDGELTEAGREGLRSAIANSLVDETPVEGEIAEPITVYFSFGHGQTDPDTGQNLVDHYVTIVGPSYAACRAAMFASRYGARWGFDYLKGDPESDAWIARWTEHERIDAMPKAES